MNGTGRIMSITFKAADDWMHTYPDYTFNATDHTWKVEKCSNLITKTGQISTCCPQGYDLIYLNDAVQITNTPMNFTFAPIPGDLDFSGHVDLVDLAMIASKFGTNYPPYDFNNSGGLVDIFDVVVVAKYYCRVVP
jgi:hypothetical protein